MIINHTWILIHIWLLTQDVSTKCIRPSFLRKIHACSPYDPVAASTTVIPTTVSNSRVTPSNHKYGWLYHIVGYTSPDIWVNYNISPTSIKAIWGWFPILTMISSEGDQWGRYNLSRWYGSWTIPFNPILHPIWFAKSKKNQGVWKTIK